MKSENSYNFSGNLFTKLPKVKRRLLKSGRETFQRVLNISFAPVSANILALKTLGARGLFTPTPLMTQIYDYTPQNFTNSNPPFMESLFEIKWPEQ